MSRRGRIGLLAAYAVCTFLSFPHPLGDRVVDLGAWLAWIGPALLLLALRGLPPRRAAAWAFAASLFAHGAVLHWIYVVTVVYGHAPVAVGVVAPVLLAAYIAAFTAGFGAASAWLARHALAFPLALAAAWTVHEHARSFVFTGFPWATLGYAQHGNPALLGLAAFTGVYGLCFVTALGATALAEFAIAARRRLAPGWGAWSAVAAVVLAHGVGLAAPDPASETPPHLLRAAVLQGNIDQGVKWSPEWVMRTLEIYEELTRRAAGQGARLVLWPESAIPGSFEWDAVLRDRVETLARETGVALVVGGVGLAFDAGPRPSAYFDSAFVVDASGALRDRYDKTHLVPFGEFVPFQNLLGLFLHAVASGMAESSVTPGEAPRAIDVAIPEAGEIGAGIPICYELLFPDLVRRFARDGAQLLLAITNDAWYGRTGAPYQFLAITTLRAAETRLWTARAANTGVSAFIDAKGRVVARTRIFERTLLVADVPLHPRPREATFYVRYGDWLAHGCWLGALGLFAAGLVRARRGIRPCANGADE
jgi:apolipoprotein N-acyltransferase